MPAACLLTTGRFRWGIFVHLDPLTVSRQPARQGQTTRSRCTVGISTTDPRAVPLAVPCRKASLPKNK